MDDQLSLLVEEFENDNFDHSDSSLQKSDFADVICTLESNHNQSYQTIGQSVTKEVVTVNPMFKIEPEVVHRLIKTDPSVEKKNAAFTASQKRNRGQVDRYNGLTEDEVIQRKLPDYLREGLDLIVVGINPSMTSASVGHHYAGIGNHFWTCITEAGIVNESVTCYDDYRMTDLGIGFTNVCSRPTKGAAEISRKEMKAGALVMLEKMRKYRPKIAVFNGKGIYEAFVGHKNFYMGRQPKPLDGTDIIVFVMPSSSARCAQLPRAEDKLPFFIALRKLRDFVKGRLQLLHDHEVIFTDYTEFRVTQPDPKSLRKAERRRKRKAEQMLALSSSSTSELLSNNNGSNNKINLELTSKPVIRKTNANTTGNNNSRLVSNNNCHNNLQTTNHKTITPKETITHSQLSLGNEYTILTTNPNTNDFSSSLGTITIATNTNSDGDVTLYETSNQNNSQILSQNNQQIEIPLAALFNQSNGVISLLPAEIFLNNNNNSFGALNFAAPNTNNNIFSINKNNQISQSPKPIILQQDALGQTYMIAAATPSSLIPPSNSSNQTTATLLPWSTGQQQHQQQQQQQPTFALIQPQQQLALATGVGNDNSPQVATVSSSNQQQIVYQQKQSNNINNNNSQSPNNNSSNNSNNNNMNCQQVICTAATLQQLLQQQQQQQQQQQIQIVNPLSFSQQFAFQSPFSIQNGSAFTNVQLQQFGQCITAETLSALEQQQQHSSVTHIDNICSISPDRSSSCDPQTITVSATTSNNSILGYSVLPSNSTNNSPNITLAYLPSHQSSQQSNNTNIVIPLSNNNNNNNNNSTNNKSSITAIVAPHSASTSSHDLDLISSSTSILPPESSSSNTSSNNNNNNNNNNRLYQQIADSEDQLIQCSSTDDKLIFTTLQ